MADSYAIPNTQADFRAASLVDLLRWRAEHQPDLAACAYLPDGEQEEARISYSRLDQQARAIAARLQQMGAPGERALLLYPSGVDFIAAYFGCLYAGVTAVPVYPPRLNRPSKRIQAIVADAQATMALTTSQIHESMEQRFTHTPDLAALHWLDTEQLAEGLEESWSPIRPTGDQLAFLQYTSGSTSAPKGVMVSHGNLMHNLSMIFHGFQIDPKGSGVFWLPTYHDMGLIGGLLEPFFVGGLSVIMPPSAFLQRPIRWLQAISRYQGTISGAPNFAYDYCVEKTTREQREGLDLSSLQTAFCGAEPIRPDTMRRFIETFEPYGLNRRALYPCYGLAEATLIVSGPVGQVELRSIRVKSLPLAENRVALADGDEPDNQEMVACGSTLLDQEIVIVDPERERLCAADDVGEIWVSGRNVAQGYWGQPELTRQTFHAFLADSGRGPFMRTGDLGFMHDGQLFVTGRLKDLIIIRGQNHYPNDIELTVAQSHDAFEPGLGAAFSVTLDGEERLVIAHELARRHRRADPDEVIAAARQAIAENHGLQLYAALLLKPFSIPKTSSGKVKRHACKQGFLEGNLSVIGQWQMAGEAAAGTALSEAVQPAGSSSENPAVVIGRRQAIEQWLIQQLAQRLRLDPQAIDINQPFASFGLDSVQAVSLAGDLEKWLDRDLPPTLVWDYPTINELARHLAAAETTGQPAQIAAATQLAHKVEAGGRVEPVAIVGLGCRFPMAESPAAFWQLLRDGRDAISPVPPDRWNIDQLYAAEAAAGKMTTRWGGFLEQIDQFDPHFFGISPREAARMDPQQRLLMEVTWEALENAGIPPSSLAGSATGVFVGISSYDYSHIQFSNPAEIDAYAGTGNAHSVAANRLSYTLDLRGPSIALDTACSSSLVAVHQATQSLRSGETDLALAGGVNLVLTPELTITFSQAQMMAADGRCKTFDARADGYVRGEGCGMIVMKRLRDAVRDGDQILAVIRGSAVNQDGRSNGLTAPNGLAQQAVIRQALANAGVNQREINYIEAHGTGTPLGDPIEIAALRTVLEPDRPPDQPLSIGSVKTNIGHLEAAAGIAGLIKVVLALQHQTIPRHINFEKLNPYISLDGSRLEIAAENRPWPVGDKPRLAGVSSFGFGGTNAHLIVGDWPMPLPATESPEFERPLHLLALSARSEATLQALAGRFADWLAAPAGTYSLADLTFSANTGRDHFAVRQALVAASIEALSSQLRELADRGPTRPINPGRPRIAFLFTGQGAQYAGMGRQLYDSEPVFRQALDRCAEILHPLMDRPLLPVLYPEQADAEGWLDQTAFTQPALFAIEFALAELWRSWGIRPDMVMGHSVGEYVAACLAGVFTLEDGLTLIAARGQLMQSLPDDGAMAVLFTTEETVTGLLPAYSGEVDIAAVNGQENVVISGRANAVEEMVERLASDGIESRPLTVSHAFHSPLMEPILAEFEQIAAGITFHAPRIPLVANVTGRLWSAGQVPDAAYWRDHIRQAVRFSAGLDSLLAEGGNIFLEIGPQPHLLGMARRYQEARPDATDIAIMWLPSLRRNRQPWPVLLDSLASLYQAGLDVDWAGYDSPYRRRKLSLPTYPFARERYWLDIAPTHARPWAAGLAGQLRRLPTAVPIYETTLDLIDDPAATYHDLALAVASELFGPGDHALSGLMIAGSLAGRRLPHQIVLAFQSAEQAILQIFVQAVGQDHWQLQASGQLTRGQAARSIDEPAADQPSVVTTETGPSTPAGLPIALSEAGPDQRPVIVGDYLQATAARVLGLPAERLDLGVPLDSLGLDSLMAVELRNTIDRDLGVTLPVVKLLQGPSIRDLVDLVLNQLASAPTTGSTLPVTALDHRPGQAEPLAFGQQAMWFLHQLLPDDISFNVAGAVKIRGPLNVSALERAVRQLVRRHAALRTTFSTANLQPVQIVHEQPRLLLEQVEPLDWGDDRLQEFLRRVAYRPFDLETGPLMRSVLVNLPDGEHILLLSINHLVTDFWSMSLLVAELYRLYRAEVAGLPAGLPLPELQYTDFANWQRALLASPEGDRLRDYWLAKLAGDLPLLDLPTDHPRLALQTFHGDSVTLQMNGDLADRLKALSQTHGATLYMTLLAAFQALLHRYSGQEDLLVGSVLAGRDRPELSGLVGYFINPVALRADLSGDPSFADFLDQVRQTVLEAYEHQLYPLPLLADQLHFERDPGRPPIFETMFIMQKAQVMEEHGLSALALGLPGVRMILDDLEMESMALGGLPAQFDLTLMMAELDGGLAAAVHYNTALFEAATMDRLLQHLEILLLAIADEPDRPLSAIPLLTAAERQQILVEWNGTAADFPSQSGLHELVLSQAGRSPQATAVVDDHGHLTYQDLAERAGQLAGYLRHLGVGPEVLVGVGLERSADMLVALLGVLQAGGAYVPLDPAFPAARLSLMLSDARPAVLLTQATLVDEGLWAAALADSDADLVPTRIVCLDRDWDRISQAAALERPVAVSPQNLAYVIYTSGSTGRPKGVQISHAAAVNFLTTMAASPGLTAEDTLLAVTTLSFDIALLELLLPLTVGATVVVASRDMAADGLALQQLIDHSGATVMQATPATWRLLLESGWPGKPGLKILCGGEALPRDLAGQLLARCPELWNMYGPTETTVWSTTVQVQDDSGPVPIGRPIANTQTYILNRALQPVPVGVVGDLYIAGDGLARGYLGQPGLTADRFRPDPFADQPGRLIYCTGDLARFRPDGQIVFLGRGDQQVKVRGFRIELGDVEAALAGHPAVMRNVVVAREDGLVAYLVWHDADQPAPAAGDLRAFLRQRLPEYMIPALFIPLDSLPLTPNNKVDRRALPAPADLGLATVATTTEYVAPRNELERQLADICAAVLGVSRVGIHDDFFELGGNSLLATRLIFQLRETFQVPLTLRYLFAQPTVAGLAQALTTARNGAGVRHAVNGQVGPRLFQEMTLQHLQSEVQLDPQITAIGRPFEPPASFDRPLLTGATGFLGAYLLRDLLVAKTGLVYCLVRAANEAAGLERLKVNLQRYDLWQDAYAGRIVPVMGDLAEPLLGLAPETFGQLADTIDIIYHNGALVNFVYPYEAHKPANVLGTQEMLRLAASGTLKPVHFVSTLSVFHTGDHDDGTVYHETADLAAIGLPFGGYAQSKWVAEQLVLLAGERGLPVAIYRPGLVSGDSQSGAWNNEDMMSTLGRASLLIGLVPNLDVDVDLVPVDYVSRAIVELSQRPDSLGQRFHLNNPRPMPFRDLLRWLGQSRFAAQGLALDVVPFERWRQKLFDLASQFAGPAGNPYLPLLEEVTAEQVFMPAFDCRQTLQGLAGSDVRCPPVSPQLLTTYLSYFIRQDLIPGVIEGESDGVHER